MNGLRSLQPCPVPGTRAARLPRAGFTLLELLIVIVIIGVLATLTVPSLKNAQKSNALASASQQLIDDISYARRLAIKDRTTVLMVFLPAVDPLEANKYQRLRQSEKNVLLRGQQTAYALYSFRQVGDQPGSAQPKFLRYWRYLPSGYFFPGWKFEKVGSGFQIDASSTREQNANLKVSPLPWTVFNLIAVPSLTSPTATNVSLPYIAFGPTGELQREVGENLFERAHDDELIPLASGPIFLARDANDEKQLLWEPADITERPPGNSTTNGFHIIGIDKLTGRTRVIKPEINP